MPRPGDIRDPRKERNPSPVDEGTINALAAVPLIGGYLAAGARAANSPFAVKMPDGTYQWLLPSDFGQLSSFQEPLRQGANAQNRVNPYSMEAAQRSLQNQNALMAQMEAARTGPSLAGMQAQRASGRMNVAATEGAMRGGPVQSIQRQAGLAAQGNAMDTATARAAEYMRLQQALGGGYAGLQGRSLQAAQAQNLAGGRLAAQDEQMRQFYAGQGAKAQLAADAAALENYKLYRQLEMQQEKANKTAQAEQAKAMTNMLSMGFSAGAK